MNYLDIDALKATGAVPQWFGLGFIQLKLNEHQRMHFWHPSLSSDQVDEEVHDHRYDFTSHVLVGNLEHHTFAFVEDVTGDHEMVYVSCEPGGTRPPLNPIAYGKLVKTGTYYLTPDSVYEFPQGEFHTNLTFRAVTLLNRQSKETEFARVVRPRKGSPVCPFANQSKYTPEQLWALIEELIRPNGAINPGYHLTNIEKGVLGEPSKIREEVEEFMDAVDQNVSIMALVELADLVGAMDAYLEKHHPTIKFDDLRAMSDVTKRAFVNGRRS